MGDILLWADLLKLQTLPKIFGYLFSCVYIMYYFRQKMGWATLGMCHFFTNSPGHPVWQTGLYYTPLMDCKSLPPYFSGKFQNCDHGHLCNLDQAFARC
jgi:hypothetical protein